MNKKFFVHFARLALGGVLIFGQNGCSSDPDHDLAVDAVNNYSDAAAKQVGGSDSTIPGFGIPGQGIAQAQNGQPVPFTGDGPSAR